jgi:hypothetical protein
MNYPLLKKNSILFNERIMMAITREDDFVSRVRGEWFNSSEQVIAVIREYNTILLLHIIALKFEIGH